MVHTRTIATEPFPPSEREPSATGGASEQVTGSLERMNPSERGRQARIAQVREATFPVALRGYDRESVDTYVERVQSLLSEFEASGSPDAAVRQALDQVGEETSSILQRAQQTANEITERSRASADDRIREAEREARALTEDAEDRVRELEADYGAIWTQRDRLLDQVRELAERLLATADDAAERYPTQDEAEAEDSGRQDTASIPPVHDERATTLRMSGDSGGTEEAAEPDTVDEGDQPAAVHEADEPDTVDEADDAGPEDAFSAGDEIDFAAAPGEEDVEQEDEDVPAPGERGPT